jgi:hypothetical protein
MLRSRMIGFYTVKSSAIFIMACIYFIAGSILSIGLDRFLTTEDFEKQTTFQLFIEVMGTLGIIAVSYYFLRIVIKRMPFFLDGLYGFQLNRLDEASGGIVIAYVLFMYQDRLENIGREFKKRIVKLL